MASTLSLSLTPRPASCRTLRLRSARKLEQGASLRHPCNRPVSLVVRAELSSSDPPVQTPSGSGLKRTEELEEKFAVLDSGKYACNSCGYVYDQVKGDPNYPIPAGMEFNQLPSDWLCPTCGAAPANFRSMGREVAGFAQNQSYGLGTNSMTSAQKSGLIWGSLVFFFMLFMGGYFLE